MKYEDLHPTNAELVLAFDCEIEEQKVEAIKEHVSRCVLCCAQWDELQATSELMAEHHATFLQSQVPAPSEHMFAFAAQLGREAVPRPIELPRVTGSSQKLAIAGAVAAVILISVGILSRIPSKSAPAVQGPPAQVASAVPPKEAVATVKSQTHRDHGQFKGKPNALPFDSQKSLARADSREEQRRVAHLATKKQPATSATAMKKDTYYELPFSDASLPLEEATVVRVKLPAQSLRAAGVPVEEENANTILQADLLLGMDGLPRGIRLVRDGSGMN
jgi:hypothetical protein